MPNRKGWGVISSFFHYTKKTPVPKLTEVVVHYSLLFYIQFFIFID
nr:MAG TPA: hypothetical protein [Caudoviricetes sp.]